MLRLILAVFLFQIFVLSSYPAHASTSADPNITALDQELIALESKIVELTDIAKEQSKMLRDQTSQQRDMLVAWQGSLTKLKPRVKKEAQAEIQAMMKEMSIMQSASESFLRVYDPLATEGEPNFDRLNAAWASIQTDHDSMRMKIRACADTPVK